jgi:hypothetical protein
MRATITGHLSLEGANVESRAAAEPAPAAEPATATAAGRIHSPITPAAAASAPRSLGAVCLSGASISGNLVLRQATLTGGAGPALLADYLTVKGDAAVCEQPSDGFVATGSGELGAVCLAGATICGQLSLLGTTLANLAGPALVAAFAQIQGDAFLIEGFTALGTGDRGSVCFTDATLGRELACSGVLANGPGPALDLTRAKVGLLRLGSGFAGRQVQGLHIRGPVELDGLSYRGVPRLGEDLRRSVPRSLGDPATTEKDKVGQWLRWFRGTGQYSAQPYQALAAAYEGAGYDNLARHILIRQGDDARARGSLSQVRRAAQFFSKWLIGYGYHCVRALAWLAGLFVLAAVLAITVFGPAKYIVTASTPGQATSSSTAPAAPAVRKCSVTGDIGYAIQVSFPIININSASGAQCDVPANGANLGMIVFGWVVRVLAALLAGVYVLGISGLSRSSPSGASS